MILVRHGLMIVGDPLGGKTSAFKILADALGELRAKELMEEFKVIIVIILTRTILIHTTNVPGPPNPYLLHIFSYMLIILQNLDKMHLLILHWNILFELQHSNGKE